MKCYKYIYNPLDKKKISIKDTEFFILIKGYLNYLHQNNNLNSNLKLVKYKLYLKQDCPFCCKLIFFITQANLTHMFVPIYDCLVTRNYLKKYNENYTFPALQISNNYILFDSDKIIDKLIVNFKINTEKFWAYNYFKDGVFPTYLSLIKYLISKEGSKDNAKLWLSKNSNITKVNCDVLNLKYSKTVQ